MLRRPLVPLSIVAIGIAGALVAVGVLLLTPSARALPAAGRDTLNVTGQVSIASRAGAETIPLSGTVTIQRDDPRIEGGVEVVDADVVSLNLEGESVTGHVAVSESATLTSSGEIRSLQPPPDQFPASSFFDVFIVAQIPFSGSRSSPTVHNEEPLQLVPMSGGSEVPLDDWPPEGVTYAIEPFAASASDASPQTWPPGEPGCSPGIPLLPSEPTKICVTDLSVTMGEIMPETPTFTPCPPDVCTPTPSPTQGPTATETPLPLPENPSFSLAPGGPSAKHPADLLGLTAGGPIVPTPVPVSGNDNFADGWRITSLPFTGVQRTAGMTTQTGEPLNPLDCISVQPERMGATVWYRYTASTSGTIFAETAGSNFDTVLAAYTGSSLGSLSWLRCDDDSGPGLQSEINFPVTAGVTYHFQIGGFNDVTGDLRLAVSMMGGGAAGKTPAVAITCRNLGLTSDGCDDGSDGDQDDMDALSYGVDFTQQDGPIYFSVSPGSSGLSGTAVAQQAACSPAEPQADEFYSPLDRTNALVFDGDGLDGGCPTAVPFGLVERPASDDLDALNEQPPSFVDSDRNGVLDEAVFLSLAAGSPTLAVLARSAADILWTVGFQPGVYASANDLGLQPGDDIDALCLSDLGEGGRYDPAVDIIAFSLAPGSPTLASLGASAADVLGPGPQVLLAAAQLGLRASDDLDAMKCPSELVPPGPMGDANCDDLVNPIDAALVLQLEAGIIGALPCGQNADVNEDGTINALDAVLILQFVAGIIDSLPPS